MIRYTYKILSLAAILFCVTPAGISQGLQSDFGKSKVQYGKYRWSFYRTKSFEVYFHDGGKSLAQYALSHADAFKNDVERALDYTVSGRISIVIFNSYSDFRQSNVSLIEEKYNTGGLTPISDNTAFVYFNGNHHDFDICIRAALSEVALNELIYGLSVQERIQNAALISLPDWFYSGLISYISNDWNSTKNEWLENNLKNERLKKFGRLNPNEQVMAGHSLWKYIHDVYGKMAIPNIVYMTHINKNIEAGFNFVIGKSFLQVYSEWYRFSRYALLIEEEDKFNEPDNLQKLPALSRKEIPVAVRLSPDADKLAIVVNRKGKSVVRIADLRTGKKDRILSLGYKKPDFEREDAFPVVDWHPRKDLLSITYQKRNKAFIVHYNFETGKKEDKRPFDKIDRVLDFRYDDFGNRLVISAIRNGASDIFLYEIRSGRLFPITSDIYDDLHPAFISGSKGIAFSSNRSERNIEKRDFNPEALFKSNFDLYYYNLENRDPLLHQITFTPDFNERGAVPIDTEGVVYLTDQNSLLNYDLAYPDSLYQFTFVYITRLEDSLRVIHDTFKINSRIQMLDMIKFPFDEKSILRIDTLAIYKDTSYIYPQSNYGTNILFLDFRKSSNNLIEVFHQGRDYQYRLSQIPEYFPPSIVNRAFNEPVMQSYKRVKVKDEGWEFLEKPRIEPVSPDKEAFAKTTDPKINLRNDSFRYHFFNETEFILKSDSNRKIDNSANLTAVIPGFSVYYSADSSSGSTFKRTKFGSSSLYFLSFTPDYLVSQFDNGYIGSIYTPYDPDNSLEAINRNTSALFMLGIRDLLKDYRISGGYRFNSSLTGAEYLLIFENLKRRIDKKISFYKKGDVREDIYSRWRDLSFEGRFQLKYPFTEYLSVKGEAFARQDRHITLSSETTTLLRPDVFSTFNGFKFELVFDNTQTLALNLLNGTRFKFYAEKFFNYENQSDRFTVYGGDFRNYLKIHRQIIWANRLAFATSTGSSKIAFYLGGVDNWLFPRMEQSIHTDPEVNFAYKSLAVNMRGFIQNIRNGNSYALLNSELRIPLFRYFFTRPIKSSFLDNFQIVPFADIGTAWTGSDPYSKDNSLNKRIIENYPFKITVNSIGDPIVSGYGVGVRSKLLGYFMKLDKAWGIEGGRIYKSITYLSFGLDF